MGKLPQSYFVELSAQMLKKLFKKSKPVMPVTEVEPITMEDIKQRLAIQREDSQGSSFMDDMMSSFDTIKISSLDIQQVSAKENVEIRQEESKPIFNIPQRNFSSYKVSFDDILSQSNTSSVQSSIKTAPSFIRDEKSHTLKKSDKEETQKLSPSKESLVPRRISAQDQSELPDFRSKRSQVAIQRKKERTASDKKSSTMNVVNRRPGKKLSYQSGVTVEPDSDDEPLGNKIPPKVDSSPQTTKVQKSEKHTKIQNSEKHTEIQNSERHTKIQINEKELPELTAPVQLSNVAMPLPGVQLPPMMLSPEQQQQMLMMYYTQISLMQQTTQMQVHLKESFPELSKSNRKRPTRPKTQVIEKQSEEELVENDESKVLSDEKEGIEAHDSAADDSNIISTSHNDDSEFCLVN